MNSRADERYAELKKHLEVDLLNIDEHLIMLPQFQMEASELASDAALAATEAAQIVSITTAEAAARIRSVLVNDKKPTEAQIAHEVLLDESVIDATNESNQAQRNKDRFRALVDSFRTKSSVLKTSAELINSGYLTPKAVLDTGRAAMDRRRQERNS